MRKVADLQIQAAQAQYNKTKNIEDEVALIEAKANKLGVLAQIEGFTTEQKEQNNALLKEEIELNDSLYNSKQERDLAQKEFEAEQEKNDLDKFLRKQELLTLEEENAREALERQKELYREGTQARVDAEQEFLGKKQDIEQKRTVLEAEEGERRKKMDQAVQDAKLNIAGNTLGLISGFLKEGSDLAKGVAIAQATISGILGVQNAFTTANANPITAVFPAYPFIQAGLAGAFSAAQIQSIANTDASGSSTSAPSSSPASEGISAPSFNVVEGTGTNQIAESINNQNTQPVKAFVVSKSVTTGQEFDRNIESRATL